MYLIGNYLWTSRGKLRVIRRSRNGAFLWVAENYGTHVKEYRFLVSDLMNNGHAFSLSDVGVFAIDFATGERVKICHPSCSHKPPIAFVSEACQKDFERRWREELDRRRRRTRRRHGKGDKGTP